MCRFHEPRRAPGRPLRYRIRLAKSFSGYDRRLSGPAVGAIAVMSRRGGGHVGVVSGVTAAGDPIVISGNHNRRVVDSVYPRGRILTYVDPQ